MIVFFVGLGLDQFKRYDPRVFSLNFCVAWFHAV